MAKANGATRTKTCIEFCCVEHEWRGMSVNDDDDSVIPYDGAIAYEDDYATGQVLRDKYELLRPIGAGGMGVVWLARDRTLDVDVAVKISRRFVNDAADLMTKRALTEARLAAQLSHSAVCRVLDFGLTSKGDPFVVSELLCGEELDQILEREGPMTAVLAVRTLLPILDGLAAAHAKGIVHRDVKPANVFLARDGEGRTQPKLLDFGVARAVSMAPNITSPGTVCGTAHYMSPEQARGSAEVDARSDLWSFCVSLYELLTGFLPFDGENYNAVLAAVLTTRPRPLVEFARCDPRLSAIVMRGLSRDKNSRFESAHELAGELAQWLLDQGEEYDVCGHALCERVLPRTDQARSAVSSPGYRSRLPTPRGLSTTVAAAKRPTPKRRRVLGIAAATIVFGSSLGVAAFAIRSLPEISSAREAVAGGDRFASVRFENSGQGSAPNAAPPVETAADVRLAPAAPVFAAAAAVPVLPSETAASSGSTRSRGSRPPAQVTAPASADGKREPSPSRPSPLPKKSNDLGYEFGF